MANTVVLFTIYDKGEKEAISNKEIQEFFGDTRYISQKGDIESLILHLTKSRYSARNNKLHGGWT